MQDVPDRRRLVLAAVFQEDGVKFGVVDNGGHFESANFVDLVEDAIRSRPQDFPLLTRYYLGVHQNGGRQGARAEG